ncbi:MAG: thymidine phosphorylase family protein [Burkholderiales bacterium]
MTSRSGKSAKGSRHGNSLALRYVGIDTYQQHVVFMRSDCHVCRSEGFRTQSRVQVALGNRSIIATVNVVHSDLLAQGEGSLSESAWRALGAQSGDEIRLSHPAPVESLGHVRAKVYGKPLDDMAMLSIMRDIQAGRYSDLQLSAFITACAGNRLDLSETVALTRAMVAVGERLKWPASRVMDKHCVGGLPGNRTTPIVVSIVAGFGLTIPKTSSRAITSPAGTADTMETLAPVDLSLEAMRKVVEREGGCIVWGAAAGLSPADDALVRVERPLELDSEGQLVASVLSKKAAAGSTHVVVDMPVGPTAKVRSKEAAEFLGGRLEEVGRAVGLNVRVAITDGTQPVGRGIGPALEARDVLAVLRGEAGAPPDLRERALTLSGLILELSRGVPRGMGRHQAELLLDDGRAWSKFQAICEAQGGMRDPSRAPHTHPVPAPRSGQVEVVDNRRLARVAKLAGAPMAPSAGVEFLAPPGSAVGKGQPLFVVHAEAPGELEYAMEYVRSQPGIVSLAEPRR